MKYVTSVIKLALAPSQNTAACLDDQSRKCNSLYNKLLEQANELRQNFKNTGNPDHARILYSSRGLRNLVPNMKEIHPYLKSVYAAPLKNTALRLTASITAYQNSQKGKRAGKATCWPKFRSWKASWFSLLYDEPNTGYSVKEGCLFLSLGLGIDRKRKFIKIPIIDAHVLAGRDIRNLRIIKDANVFNAIFTVIRTVPKTKPIKKIIALDPNHKNLAYGVDNEGQAIEIHAAHWLKTFDKRLDEIKSKRDRCKKKSKLIDIVDDKDIVIKQCWEPSRRYKKIDDMYKKILAQRREQTKSFCYRTAHLLFKRYDLVAIGDYTPQGQGITTSMRRAINNRSLIGRFKETVEWVAIKSGKTYQEFAEKGTTRTCHACLFVVASGIHPAMRTWNCPGCSAEHIRDENAACNGLIKILPAISLLPRVEENPKKISREFSLPVPGSGRVLIQERWAWRVLSSGTLVCRGGKTADLSAPTRN